jgi:hypothetical protein
MGLGREAGQSRFVNFLKGELVTGPKDNKVTYSFIEGDIIDLHVEPAEYQGKEYRKVTVYIQDNDADGSPVYQLGFPLESGYGASFSSMARNIDFKLPVKISGGMEKMKDSDLSYSKMFIRQNGKYVKWYYTKDNDAGKKMPPPEKITKGKDKGKMDYSARNDWYEKMLFEVVLPEIRKVWPNGADKKSKAKPEGAEIVDDLPF